MPTANTKPKKGAQIQMWIPPDFKREIEILSALSGKKKKDVLKELAKKVREHNRRLNHNDPQWIDFTW